MPTSPLSTTLSFTPIKANSSLAIKQEVSSYGISERTAARMNSSQQRTFPCGVSLSLPMVERWLLGTTMVTCSFGRSTLRRIPSLCNLSRTSERTTSTLPAACLAQIQSKLPCLSESLTRDYLPLVRQTTRSRFGIPQDSVTSSRERWLGISDGCGMPLSVPIRHIL